jgi:exodeoxyribonuclease VII small subunit
MSYNEQLKQLEHIVSEIESGQLSIDQLAEKVKIATKLLADCRKQLTKVESDINKILKPQK